MTAALCVSVLLIVLCVTDGQSTTSDDSHCSYTFKVPAADCSQTSGEDQVLKSSVIGLQAQIKLLTKEIATIKAGAVGGSVRRVFNLKQCSQRNLPTEGAEHGVIWSCGLVKKMEETVLRVVWNGALRLRHGSGASCRRWFFTLNGNECSEPQTIDTQLHIQIPSSNLHRPAYVEGYCRGIPAGHVNVAWNVGDCVPQASMAVGDSSSGWGATVRIIVEELDIDDAVHVIT